MSLSTLFSRYRGHQSAPVPHQLRKLKLALISTTSAKIDSVRQACPSWSAWLNSRPRTQASKLASITLIRRELTIPWRTHSALSVLSTEPPHKSTRRNSSSKSPTLVKTNQTTSLSSTHSASLAGKTPIKIQRVKSRQKASLRCNSKPIIITTLLRSKRSRPIVKKRTIRS